MLAVGVGEAGGAGQGKGRAGDPHTRSRWHSRQPAQADSGAGGAHCGAGGWCRWRTERVVLVAVLVAVMMELCTMRLMRQQGRQGGRPGEAASCGGGKAHGWLAEKKG